MIADRYVQYMVAYRVDHDTLENSIAGEHFTAQKATDVGYSAGDFVVYNDEFYRCKQSYKQYILPTNTSYWEKIILTSYFSHFIEHNYSTTEHVVGTWINGKPLYEITMEILNWPLNSYAMYEFSNVGISDIDEIVSEDGAYIFANDTSHIQYPVIVYGPSNFDHYVYRNGAVFHYTYNSIPFKKIIYTIRYTKTTD